MMNEQNEQLPEMASAGDAFMENPSLSAMGSSDPPGGMDAETDTPSTGDHMSEPAPSAENDEEGKEYPDMAAHGDGAGLAAPPSFVPDEYGEGYVRLQVHVTGGDMVVTDAAVINGPLVTNQDLTGDMVYQALVRERRVAAEAMPELGYAVGLIPPDDPDKGHHFGKLDEFDFNVRIPRGDLTVDDLAELEIELFRPAETTALSIDLAMHPGQPIAQAVANAGTKMPKVVARLQGVDVDTLPVGAATELRTWLR